VRGYQGVVKNVSALSEVYRTAGPEYAAFFTNACLQKMPFVGPISWRRTSIRTKVTVSGQIDIAAFRQNVGTEIPNLYEDESGRETTFIIWSRAGDRAAKTYGFLNSRTRNVELDSHSLEQRVNDDEWHHITNR
jgi:hypothetical protein